MGQTTKATRLYPLPPREVPADSIYTELEAPPKLRREPGRPYVLINMVTSLDGSTSMGGKASPLGSHVDRQTMRNLRAKADAVMVGAGTLRAERLSLGLDEPAHGSQPLAVILTTSGDVPLEKNLVIGADQELLVITTPEAHDIRLPPKNARLCTLSSNEGGLDLSAALQTLHSDHGVEVLLVEGGPRINNSLLSKNLADELFLTLAPKLVGVASRRPAFEVEASTPTLSSLAPKLLSVHQASGELFCRYRLAIDP